MKVLKGHTKNQYRSEASIVERYIVEEPRVLFRIHGKGKIYGVC